MSEKPPKNILSERPEERRRVKVIELKPDKFIEIIESSSFLEALGTAAKETRASGYETGFSVNILEDQTPFIPEVAKGGTDRMFEDELIKTIDGDLHLKTENWDKRSGELLAFHFHPEAEGLVIPSGTDLMHFLDYSQASAFLGVGQVDTRGNVKILLIMPQTFVVDESIAEYEEGLSAGLNSQEGIQSLLKDCGFNSMLISFVREKGKYILKVSRRKLMAMGSIRVLTSLSGPEENLQ